MSPRRAPHLCNQPGCSVIVNGPGNCPAHQHARAPHDPAQQRFYNSARWKQLRAIVRAQEPTCSICAKAPSTSVDHIDGDWTNNERANLRALCTSCERSRTARQHRAKAPGGEVSR